jgi:hypothetical protein
MTYLTAESTDQGQFGLLEGYLSDEDMISIDQCIPDELQQKMPRKFRLSADGMYYLYGSLLVSIVFLTFVIGVGINDARLISKGNRLAHEGQLIYTDDVQAGGATVYYSFTYNGETYHSEAFLPKKYLSLVERYSKSGSFPVLFLPNNPSINHPYDWHDTVSLLWLRLFVFFCVVFLWSVQIPRIRLNLRLIRSGVAVVGRVTSCRLFRNGGILLKYEFRDMDGLLTEGKGECSDPKKIDAQVCVLYIPGETAKSRPYPLVFFRAVK